MIRAKEIQWGEQLSKLGFYRSCNISGVVCIMEKRKNGKWDARIKIKDVTMFSHKASLTLDEAKAWCQSQLNSFIQQIGEEV